MIQIDHEKVRNYQFCGKKKKKHQKIKPKYKTYAQIFKKIKPINSLNRQCMYTYSRFTHKKGEKQRKRKSI